MAAQLTAAEGKLPEHGRRSSSLPDADAETGEPELEEVDESGVGSAEWETSSPNPNASNDNNAADTATTATTTSTAATPIADSRSR